MSNTTQRALYDAAYAQVEAWRIEAAREPLGREYIRGRAVGYDADRRRRICFWTGRGERADVYAAFIHDTVDAYDLAANVVQDDWGSLYGALNACKTAYERTYDDVEFSFRSARRRHH